MLKLFGMQSISFQYSFCYKMVLHTTLPKIFCLWSEMTSFKKEPNNFIIIKMASRGTRWKRECPDQPRKAWSLQEIKSRNVWEMYDVDSTYVMLLGSWLLNLLPRRSWMPLKSVYNNYNQLRQVNRCSFFKKKIKLFILQANMGSLQFVFFVR